MKHMIQMYGSWTEMFLCHPIEISISLERLYQPSPFFHHCKGEFMTYLEMDIICSRFFLFLKYSFHPMIAFFLFFFFDSPGIKEHALPAGKRLIYMYIQKRYSNKWVWNFNQKIKNTFIVQRLVPGNWYGGNVKKKTTKVYQFPSSHAQLQY